MRVLCLYVIVDVWGHLWMHMVMRGRYGYFMFGCVKLFIH